MPDQQNVNFTEACKRFDEAIRAIEKYQYKAEKEPNALLNPTLDKHNGIYYVNPCMFHEKGARNISKGLKEFYKQKTGKDAKANTSICTSIVTMPKNFIQAHYNLKDWEYVLMEKFVQEEKLNSNELTEIEKIQKKMVHIEWTPEEMQEIHMYFKAMEKAYCITAGIKGCEVKEDENGSIVEDYSNSDILWSISHLSESWPHLHLGFLPMSYIKEEQMDVLEKYEKDKEERNEKVEELVASGVTPKEAAKMIPTIKQPQVLYGNKNRKIESNEKPIGCTVKKYSKGYLHALNRRLEERMLEQGIETKIANGKGNQFDLAKTGKKKRFEESTKDKMIEALLRREKELEQEVSQMEEAATKAIFEKENAQAEASAYKEEVAKATEDLLLKTELLEEKEIELAEKEQQVESLRSIIADLQKELKALVKEVALFVPNVVKAFIQSWKDAKTFPKMEKVDAAARAKALAGAEEMANPLKDLAMQAEALLEEDVVNGVNMSTFDKDEKGQKENHAKSQIKNAAKHFGYEEDFASNHRLMELALKDWFNKEKYRKELAKRSEVDAGLFMKNRWKSEVTQTNVMDRAVRAIEYALERENMLEEEMEQG